jgi:hypothetical protein
MQRAPLEQLDSNTAADMGKHTTFSQIEISVQALTADSHRS